MSGVLDRVTEAYVAMVCPTEDSPALEPAARLARLAPEFPELAADTVLNPALDGRLAAVVAQAADRLSQDLPGLAVPGRTAVCRTFMELALNLIGIEADKAGFAEAEREEAFAEIQRTLERWQATTEVAPALQAVVAEVLQEMNKVLMGKGMSARMAESIEARLEPDNLAGSFLAAARGRIRRHTGEKFVPIRLRRTDDKVRPSRRHCGGAAAPSHSLGAGPAKCKSAVGTEGSWTLGGEQRA